MRPNVVWIVFDTARADAFEPYGATVGSSPVVAELARRGTVAKGMHSTACWTLPAHLSMFAGGMPRGLGLADVAGISVQTAHPIVESHRDRLLPEVLRRSGYSTGAISANSWISRHSGFATGFDRFVDRLEARRQAKMSAATLPGRARWLLEGLRADSDDGAAGAALELEAWAAQRSAAPFFWFVNLVECHSPYLPPKPHAELGPLGRVRAAADASRWLTMGAFWQACATGQVPDEATLERMRAGYRGAISYMDAWLGRVLDAIGPRLDETLVIVSSDHGENFGEGRLIGHGFSLDERLTHVPFVAAGPGADRLADARSLAEVPALLADIVGLSDHPYRADALPPLPVAQFDSPAPPADDPRTQSAIALWGLDEAATARLVTPLTSAVDGTVKLVRRGSVDMFYDLAADSMEASPLGEADVDSAAVRRLRAALDHPAVVASESRLRAASPPNGGAPDLADLEDRMRLLGYL